MKLVKPPPTQEEIDRLFEMLTQHILECKGYRPSDEVALEEMLMIWKAITAVRKAGAWVWWACSKLGMVVLKWGAVVTAAVYLYQQLRAWGILR